MLFRSQAEGVFDALLTKSQSVFSAIGNALKTAVLTAIKEVVSSRVAAMLMQLFTGTRVTFAQGGTGAGVLGRLGGILGIGAVPVFGGGGTVPGLGGFGIPGAPGGTVGFSGPVSMGGSPGGVARTGGAWGASAYEILVTREYGEYTWKAIWDAGTPLGITAFGLDARSALEKVK